MPIGGSLEFLARSYARIAEPTTTRQLRPARRIEFFSSSLLAEINVRSQMNLHVDSNLVSTFEGGGRGEFLRQ